MSKLEDLQPNASVQGILPHCLVTVVSVQRFGSEAIELTYKDPTGKVANELLYRQDEPRLEVVVQGRPWSFDGDGHLFRLVSEAQRIRLVHLFDPLLAVHTSVVEPLPHQITAVYEAMLPCQPLRFLLADDPGAGKTIMAGLLIKELILRGDLQRCLVVCPGSLVEQWQDELYRRFHLPFEILTNDKLEAARTGNWFLENHLVIARLDKLSRDASVQDKLAVPEGRWDLIVCDEAHKMSATYFSGEIKYTKRYKLGQVLSTITRHFLLMTATPHHGKEADFQLFMSLLDGDRFAGQFRDGVHATDVSDLMRRMVKESLLKFDTTPLFPPRLAHTVPYKLSVAEARLYQAATDYVRAGFNRADALQDDKRAGTVGFALTILQRRLASSPEAIYQSLRRRKERLESRRRELELLQRGAGTAGAVSEDGPILDAEEAENLEDAPDDEIEAIEAQLLDQATAARTITEFKAEIAMLTHLESLAQAVRRSGEDKKWRELAKLLCEIFTPAGIADRIAEEPVPYTVAEASPPKPSPGQKLVIFTEHRDTLNYLEQRIATLLGRKEAVVCIHGSMGRENRLKAQESFRHDPEVKVLLATDAAGEGINLQRAHLMVNYDLPWNPNRIDQRFGRIHRIGQTEVCHLWNLVAVETREGEVYHALLAKLEEARRALGGQVFDVLGKVEFEGRSLRDLLIEAVREGERPEVRMRLTQKVAAAFDPHKLRDLLEASGAIRHLHYAPYLDYRPLRQDEPDVAALLGRPECTWISRELEQKAQTYAIAHIVPEHLEEVRSRKLALIARTEAAVQERLTKEISLWDHRAEALKLQEQAGKPNARLNSNEARRRADLLEARLHKRIEKSKLEKQLSLLPPVILGGLLVIPAGLLWRMAPARAVTPAVTHDTQEVAACARAIIMDVERRLGFEPTDREHEKLGYDIESRVPGTGKLRFIEVKGRMTGAQTIAVTCNEILYSLNKPDDYILAIVAFTPNGGHRVHYVLQPFRREPDFGATSVDYSFAELLARAQEPV
jgi:SNF2 family DNA or RNA helicase